MPLGDIFGTLFYNPIINLLAGIYQGLNFIHLPGALGFAIILLTVVIRILVWPLMATQLKSAKKMADLKPHLDQLKEKHKGDKQALASAQMALYKEHGVNPAGGCLPAIIQIPVIWSLYQTILAFFSPSGVESVNKVLYPFVPQLSSTPDLNFFGLNLGSKPSDFGMALVVIPVLTAGLQFIQSKMMISKPVSKYPGDTSKEKAEKEGVEDSMMAMQSQMVYLMPIMIGYFAFQFPIGLALYWNTFTILGIIQQYLISGWGGMEELVKKVVSR